MPKALVDPNAVLIADDAVTEGYIAAGAVTEAKIGALAVTSGKLGALAVTSAKLDDLAVTEGKIAALAVTNAKIADATIASAKIVSLAADKIVAGSGIINNLTIKAVLTLGAGGSIVDADGSTWDQNVLRLVSAGAEGDALVFKVGSVDRAYMSADSSDNAIFALHSAGATNPTSLLLRDGELVLGFEGLGFNTLRPRVMVTTEGVAVTGNTTPDFAGSVLGIFIAEALTVPSGTPSGGGVLFVESGSLKFRTSGGNTRTVASV